MMPAMMATTRGVTTVPTSRARVVGRRGGERRAQRVGARGTSKRREGGSERAAELRAMLAEAGKNLSGGNEAVKSVAEARALIERTRAEKKRRECVAPTSARLAALEKEASELRDEVRRLRDENQEAVDALLAEAAAVAEQMARTEEVEGELEEARLLNKRLVSAAQELAELVDETATEELEAELAVKDAEIASLKATISEIEDKLEDRDALLATIRSLEIELAESVTSAELAELAAGKVNSPELILALEAENKEMRERINALVAKGSDIPAVTKKYEAAALEVVSLKSRIRLLEVQMADMVDQQELDEIIQQERSKNAELAQVTAQKDNLLQRIRELEVAMSDMEEGDVFLKAKKEAEVAKLQNMDLSALVDSLTAKLAEQTDATTKARAVTDEALANVRALEGDMAYMDYAPGIESAVKAAKQMETAAERAAELAAGLQQLEAGMTKKSSGRKTPFKRGGTFSLKKKMFNEESTSEPVNAFKRSPTDSFTLRKFDFTKVKAAAVSNKPAFTRAPESEFKLRKMTFPFSSRTAAAVPKSAFKRSGNFELRRFVFTSDPVDVAASGIFERSGDFTLRKLKFPPSERSKNGSEGSETGARVFKF